MGILLGSVDKAPTTNGGRILVTFQFFFALILMSLYTGGVAAFLMMEDLTFRVRSFSDFMDPNSMYAKNIGTEGVTDMDKICVPSTITSVSTYLSVQTPALQAEKIPGL